MSDPAIKLFGKTIALSSTTEEGGGDDDKGLPESETTTETKDKEQESPISEEKREPVTVISTADDAQKPSSDDQETVVAEKNSKTEEQQNEKPLKKPDKILPCPRCNSMETKFCYYNNYNVNQPRHFCKNCQRYWTAGGTMRNVPVGAGRRKNKNSSASNYRHLTVSDATLQAIPDPFPHPTLQPNTTVLSFGSETPICESMASVLNLAEKTMKNGIRNGFHRSEEWMEEQSSGSSVTASNSTEGGTGANLQEPTLRSVPGFAPPVPYINGFPWPYPWSPPPPPAFCASNIPIPFYPATAYWGCSTWSLPWLPPLASPSPATGSSGSGPISPTLGKHSREGNVLIRESNNSDQGDTAKQSNQERRLWIPKTLRIDDPEDAAKSSIWATMGFKNDKGNTISGGGGLFKAFQTKDEIKNHTAEASHVLHANPAALSRSINFLETS